MAFPPSKTDVGAPGPTELREQLLPTLLRTEDFTRQGSDVTDGPCGVQNMWFNTVTMTNHREKDMKGRLSHLRLQKCRGFPDAIRFRRHVRKKLDLLQFPQRFDTTGVQRSNNPRITYMSIFVQHTTQMLGPTRKRLRGPSSTAKWGSSGPMMDLQLI